MSRRLILAQPLGRKMKAGDVAYWDGSNVKTIDVDNWNTSLGTPIGVVVIPEGLLPDGIGRIVSLMAVDSSGNVTTSHTTMGWDVSGFSTDTGLTNYTTFATNAGSNTNCYLPSDQFTSTKQSDEDPKAYYYYSSSSNNAPSPYLGEGLNPNYCKVSGNNAFSDFGGLYNTEFIVGLNKSKMHACNAAYSYNDGISNIQWYLPAAGELGFLIVRYKTINASISKLGAVSVPSGMLLSSTESGYNSVMKMRASTGYATTTSKSSWDYVRPFAMLPLSDSSDSPSSDLITFTIDGVEYQAEQGMTWAVWCESSYNTGGYFYGTGETSDVIYTTGYARYINLNLADPSTTEIEEISYNTATRDWPL